VKILFLTRSLEPGRNWFVCSVHPEWNPDEMLAARSVFAIDTEMCVRCSER